MTTKFFKKKSRIILGLIFIIGLVYLLLPGPTRIEDFTPLPDSKKSNLDGDTWQNPNLTAYFSNFDRIYITAFYKNNLSNLDLVGVLLPPLSLNHPPEYAYTYVRDQQESTFLEEYTYPLRGSLFVNGYEPRVENKMHKKVSNFIGDNIFYQDNYYSSKATIRFYPTSIFFRIIIYLGIWVAFCALYRITFKAFQE